MVRPERAKITISSRSAIRFLVILLAIDLGFLVIHASHVRFDVPGSGLWLISRDRGFPEIFQYLKEALVTVTLVVLHRRRSSPVYLAWAAVFCYLLLDDSLRIHETLGDRFVEWFGLTSTLGADARDVGQVLVSATAGVVLLGVAAAATFRDRSPARWLSIQLGLVIVALAFFGVATDVIDPIDLFGLVEDGGEMAAMSVAAVLTANHAGWFDGSGRPKISETPV